MGSMTPVISQRHPLAVAALALPAVGAADVAVTIVNVPFPPTPLTIPLGITIVRRLGDG